MTTGHQPLLLRRRQATPPSLVTRLSQRPSGCKRLVVVQMEEVSGFERTSVRKRSGMNDDPETFFLAIVVGVA